MPIITFFRIHLLLSTATLLLLPLFPHIQAYPYYHLTSARPKCLRAESYEGLTLAIQYEAPNLIVLTEDDSELAVLSKMQRDKERVARNSRLEMEKEREEGPLSRGQRIQDSYGKNSQERMVAASGSGSSRGINGVYPSDGTISNLSITIQEITYVMDKSTRKVKTVFSDETQTHEIKQSSGIIHHTLSDEYESLEICVKCLHASPFKPTFVSLRLREKHDHMEDDVEGKSKNKKQQNKKVDEDQHKAKAHLSWLEKQLMDMIHQANLLEREARHAKERHYESFIQASTRLNSSSALFPKIQSFFIILVGAYQVKIIIANLRRMHVIR